MSQNELTGLCCNRRGKNCAIIWSTAGRRFVSQDMLNCCAAYDGVRVIDDLISQR